MKKAGVDTLHTTHCLGSGEIMISALGDSTGEALGNISRKSKDP